MIGISEAKKCQESVADIRLGVAPQKLNKNIKTRHIFRNFRGLGFSGVFLSANRCIELRLCQPVSFELPNILSNAFLGLGWAKILKQSRKRSRQFLQDLSEQRCTFCVVVVVAFFFFFFFVLLFLFIWEPPNLTSFSVSFIVRCTGEGVLHLTYIFLLLLLQQQRQEQQHFLHSYANKSASRQNNFVLKHATDARRRKFSNDDDVERARE